MAILLVDIGNSTADFRVFEKGKIEQLIRPVTVDSVYHNAAEISKVIKSCQYKIEKIIYSSVVSYYNKIIEDLANLIKVECLRITINNFDVNKFEVEHPDTMGTDFLCNYSGVIEKGYDQCICVSMGTATTIFVVLDKKFIGATISPGIELSANSLFQGTDLINKLTLSHDKNLVIGKNTKQALDVGVFNGHFYMIEGLIKRIKEKHNIENVVFTGGNCFKFLDFIKNSNYQFIEDLIFIGISKFI